MKTVILCGGRGIRLQEETVRTPKPLLHIGGIPILCHIMQWYARYGLTDFVLPLGYMGNAIRDYFMCNGNADNISDEKNETITYQSQKFATPAWTISFCDTGENTGKGARIKKVAHLLNNERFMLTYGDGLANVNLHALLQHHTASQLTTTFTGIRTFSRYGMARFDAQDNIVAWEEKPLLPDFINGGFFVCEPELLDYLDTTPFCELEAQPMERLAAHGKLGMYRHTGAWQCMDTYRDYQYLNDLWSRGKAFWLRHAPC